MLGTAIDTAQSVYSTRSNRIRLRGVGDAVMEETKADVSATATAAGSATSSVSSTVVGLYLLSKW